MRDQRYPLHWPAGWPRTNNRDHSRFRTATFSKARAEIFAELERMGATDEILSTDIPLKKDGQPYAVYRLDDPGVAVYFKYKGRPMVFACDKFLGIEENMWAIAKTINAIRGIERWGASEMMERAFTGFEALPEPESWRTVLGHHDTVEGVEKAYRLQMKHSHPDVGGSNEMVHTLNKARDQAISELSQ